MAALSPDQIEALEQLGELWKGLDYCVIGATALQLQVALPRKTHDLDISLVVDVREYLEGLGSLEGWKPDPAFEPRWFSPKGVRVDVIPSGGGGGELTWPTTQLKMSLLGMRLAVEKKIMLNDSGIEVPTATIPVVAVLKMAAFLDRPYERERDLEDLAFLLERYVADDDDRRFSDEIMEAGVLDEDASSFLLGSDIAIAVTDHDDEGKLVERFIGDALGEEERNAILSRSARVGPTTLGRDPEKVRARIEAFRLGFSKRK